ncbi:MAG: hypothetical protein ACLPN2_04825 [Terriglobales bacterium]
MITMTTMTTKKRPADPVFGSSRDPKSVALVLRSPDHPITRWPDSEVRP